MLLRRPKVVYGAGGSIGSPAAESTTDEEINTDLHAQAGPLTTVDTRSFS